MPITGELAFAAFAAREGRGGKQYACGWKVTRYSAGQWLNAAPITAIVRGGFCLPRSQNGYCVKLS
ncbi:hypothetical protein KCP78_20785 [Salmonella enterica subsp. enterica]|nr:hypothetical protein KCP78_20785 [Salmonella enterica subsp. enterica]